MKKSILSFSICFMLLNACAQDERYTSMMKEQIAIADTASSLSTLKSLSALFERIGETEKNRWHPFYYAALTQVNAGYNISMKEGKDMTSEIDLIVEKAEKLIAKAEALSKDNSEIFIVKKMIFTLHMMVAPMKRYMVDGPKAQSAMEMAKKLSPENPRIYLLEAEDMFFTPEQLGGSKQEAKKLFEQAIKKYDAFKPASDIDPNWGRSMITDYLRQIN